MSNSITGYFYLFLILLSSFVYPWYFRCLNNFSLLMEERHSEKWRLLGRPKLDASISLSNMISFIRFIWLKEYLFLDDYSLISIGNKTRCLLMAGIIIFMFFLAVPFVGNK